MSFCRLGSTGHINTVVNVEKRGLTALNSKVWQLNSHQSRPLGHYKNNTVWAACWEALLRSSSGSDSGAFRVMNHVLSFLDGEQNFLRREVSNGKFKGRLFNTSYLKA